jgi:CHASE2 domain-containing sensor protein
MRRKKIRRATRRKKPQTGAGKSPVSLGRRFLKAVPLMLLAVLFTFILNRAGLLNDLETTLLDTQMRLDVPSGESDVVIVDITQQDFAQTFAGETRPLKPESLRKLIDAVARGGPCVIGVDIDTSFSQFKDFKAADEWPVIWARETEEVPADVNQKATPLDVLGGQNPALNDRSGIPFLIDDPGRITRRYTRLIETTQGNRPSFAWAVYKEAKSRNCRGVKFPELPESTDPLLIRYSRGVDGVGRPRITATNIIRLAESGDWQNNNLIKNKIVLLGGSYLGDDKHDTPLGVMTGLEVMANVVESELRGGGIKPPNLFTMGLLLFFDGVLLIGVFQVLPLRRALLFSFPLIIVISLACSFITYRSLSRWVFFAPIMLGVVLTELIDMMRDRYKREIKTTYHELSGQKPPAEE